MSRKTRKLMWSVPLIAAVAVIGALAAFMTLQPNQAEAQQMEPPGKVQNLSVSAYEDGNEQQQVEVTWEAPTDGGAVASYRIDISEDGKRWYAFIPDHKDRDLRVVYPDDVTNTIVNDDNGLPAGTTRHFRVFAFGRDGADVTYGRGSEAMGTTASSEEPEAVDDLVVESEGATEEFSIDMNADGDATDTAVPNVKEIDHLIDFNKDGDFDDTIPMENETGHGTDLATTWQGSRQTTVHLSWEAPDDPPGAPVTHYIVQRARGDGNIWTTVSDEVSKKIQTVDGKVHFYDIGRESETKWQYRVYAVNSVGNSPVSDGVTGNTAASTAPMIIMDPVIGLIPNTTDVHMKWTPQTNPPGDPVTGYIFQARESLFTVADDGTTDDVDESEESQAEGDWLPLHGGDIYRVDQLPRPNTYNFFGSDIRRAEISLPSPLVVNPYIDALQEIDVRIVAINRVNTNDVDDIEPADPDGDVGDKGQWVLMSDIRVGHEDAPQKPDRPRVDKDQTQHEGRSGLNVIWKDASFVSGQGPTAGLPATNQTQREAITTAYNEAVSYFVEQDGTDVDTSTDAGTQPMVHGPETEPGSALAQGGATDRPGYDDDELKTETERKYRIYAVNELLNGGTVATDVDHESIDVDVLPADATSISGNIASVRSLPSTEATGETARPQLPGQPLNLSVIEDGHTEVRLTWGAPMTNVPEKSCPIPPIGVINGVLDTMVEDDGSECGDSSAITGYRIERSDTGDDSSSWTTVAPSTKSPYLDTMLEPDKQYYYRVYAVNSRGEGDPTAHQSDTTSEPSTPTPPGGLVAEGYGHTAIKLCWLESNFVDPLIGDEQLDENLPVLGYNISYVDGDGNEVVLVANTGSTDTVYTDMTVGAAGMERTYRVRSITLGGVGVNYAEASATTGPADAPGMPRALSATAVNDMQIDVSWTAPADNGGATVTGYVLQRKSGTDDFMTIAATNAATWWNALDCPMMNDAVPADATPAPGSDDPDADPRSPYCYMYDGLSDEAEAVVDAAFADAYDTITGTSYMDMGLMVETEYTYQVRAVNSAGAGMWSDPAATATTAPTDTSLGEPTETMATPGTTAGTATVEWTPGDNATMHWVLAIRSDGATDGYVWEMATADSSHTLTGLTSGQTYIVGISAGMGSGDSEEWSDWDFTTVTAP